MDIYGVSGVNPGEIAKTTAYGPQIVKVTISKAANGQALTTEDMIRNLIPVSYTHLDVYKRQPSVLMVSWGLLPFGVVPSGLTGLCASTA